MNKIVHVFEHRSICVGTMLKSRNGEQIEFTATHKSLLERYNERHGDKHFRLIHNGIKFTQYVGVVQAGNLTIEILPKADKHAKEDESLWQKVLFQMLKECHFVRMESVSEAHLKYRSSSILDLYFEEYLNEVQELLHHGLVKRYRSNSGNVLALKGSLQFAQNIRHNLVHKERFYTRHQVYDPQHKLNQILRQALCVLQLINVNPLLSDKINRALLDFPELPEIAISDGTFELLRFDRKTERYKKAIEIAKMILLNLSPDIRGGRNHVFALLFDMNKIWEEYIYRQIKKVIPSASRQNSTPFWLSNKGNPKTIRPDIVCEGYVIDTKWKTLDLNKLSDGDLQQMFIYNTYKDKKLSFLIYPGKETAVKLSGIYRHDGRQCALMTVNPLHGEALNRNIGEDISSKINDHLSGKSAK